jgi:hypothetical protein
MMLVSGFQVELSTKTERSKLSTVRNKRIHDAVKYAVYVTLLYDVRLHDAYEKKAHVLEFHENLWCHLAGQVT